MSSSSEKKKSLTSSCVALSPSAAADEACVDEAFFDDGDAPWLRRSGRAEAAVVEEKRLLFLLDIFFSLEEEVGKNAEFFFSFSLSL